MKPVRFYIAVIFLTNGTFFLDLDIVPMAMMNLAISVMLFASLFPGRKICPICQKTFPGSASYCPDCKQGLQSATIRKIRNKLKEVRKENG